MLSSLSSINCVVAITSKYVSSWFCHHLPCLLGFPFLFCFCCCFFRKGKPYIYHVIDWNKPVNATLTVMGVILLSCCVYMALFTVYKLRTLLYRRLNNATFILPTTTPPPPITKKHIGTGIKHSPSGISMVLGDFEGHTNPAFSKSSENITKK